MRLEKPFVPDNQGATEWAREFLRDPMGIIVDTETTSLKGYAVQVAILTNTGKIAFNHLMNPREPISAEATKIHGIHDWDVDGLHDFEFWWDHQLGNFLTFYRVVAWNAPFDRGVINRETARMKPTSKMLHNPNDMKEWECVMRRWSQWSENERWSKLDGNHTVIGDCIACLARISRMAAG